MSGNLTELGLLLGGKSVAGFSEAAVWEYVGRNFCILYCLFLADFGRTAVSNPLFGTVTQPAVSNTIANIFVDQVLYENYLEYLRNLESDSFYIQLTNASSPVIPSTTFTPLQPVNTTFRQTYSCQQRQLKSGANFLISVIAADYAFIVGGYSLIIWIAGAIQKRRKDGSKPDFS